MSRSPSATPESIVNVALNSDLMEAPPPLPEAIGMDVDEEDEVVGEFPVYLNNQLSSSLYLLQYPMRNTPFAPRQGPMAARIKPRAKMVQLDLPLDTRSRFYNTEKGEDFAMGMHDKAIKTAYDRRMEEHEDELRYGTHSHKQQQQQDELLDKMTLTSTEVPTQTKYVVGVIHNDELHLTPLRTVIQMRPGFNYLDKIDDKWKAANKRIQDVERQEEKKKMDNNQAQTVQVSMKHSEGDASTRRNLYSMAVRNADEETWKPVSYYDQTTTQAEEEYNKLYCNQSVQLQSTMDYSEYLDQISAMK